MTTNAGFEYGNAVEKYQEAKTNEWKLRETCQFTK